MALSESEVRKNVAEFNEHALEHGKHGCDVCGGSIEAVFDRVTRDGVKVPALVLDIAHSDAGCPVLREKGGGTFPLGGVTPQVMYRHRFDDGDPTWWTPRFGLEPAGRLTNPPADPFPGPPVKLVANEPCRDPVARRGGTVAIGATCHDCGKEATSVVYSEPWGDADFCELHAERWLAELHGKAVS